MDAACVARASSDYLTVTIAGSGSMLFNGLRVRMGIATGTLAHGTSLRASSILQAAKLVSDAAAGGQILLDSATFSACKVRC